MHRSLAGPDAKLCTAGLHRQNFNPQVPCGTRPSAKVEGLANKIFQSTGPLRDPTLDVSRGYVNMIISIHRSLAGPDWTSTATSRQPEHFNPQVPCGTRLGHRLMDGLKTQNFNPQVPCGTRLLPSMTKMTSQQFQSTGPLRDPTEVGTTELDTL